MIVICRKMTLEMDQCFLNFSHVSHIHIPLVLLFFTYCFSLNCLLFKKLKLILSSNSPEITKHYNVFPKTCCNKCIQVYCIWSE